VNEPAGVADDEWDFWDEVGLDCVSYNSRIDTDALAVLRLIAAKKGNGTIAAELGLPEQYVELLQSIFCSMGWCDYGTSPRTCFIDPTRDGAELIARLEKYMNDQWGELAVDAATQQG